MFSSRKSSAPVSGAFTLTKSLRLRNSASAYLTRTPSTAGNRKTFTFSTWVKKGALGTNEGIFCADNNDITNIDLLRFLSSNALRILLVLGSGPVYGYYDTNAIFTDPSAWYHIVMAIDTTQATDVNRVKLYVNNVQQSFSGPTYPSQNYDCLYFNNTISHFIGQYGASSAFYDGYITDTYFIDGQALTPSSFGATNATTGQWSPARYTGTYGTNGFHLTFANATSTTTLGYDTSGNSNNFTTNNISLTAGSTYDSMNDVPVAYSATAANYAVMNPNDKGGYTTFANGNLQTSNSTTVWTTGHATIGMTTGKWYWECYPTTAPNTINFLYGISTARVNLNSGLGFDSYGWSYYKNGDKYTNSVNTAYGASWTLGDTIGVAFDADAGTLTFYKNGTSQGTAFSGLTSGPYFPSVSSYDSNTAYINFGQQPFTYTPPTGYLALNTYNLPTPAIVQGNKYMDATTYTGNGSSQSITNAGSFQPDFVWVKSRSNTTNNWLFDSVRGANVGLISNATNAEANYGLLPSFNSNGFGVGAGASYDGTNYSAYTYVGWQWKASNATAVSNTSGSITSSVSANTTAGFSIVTYTGNGTAGATVGHGLGVTPSMIIVKGRAGLYGADHWDMYHSSLGATQILNLNLSNAAVTSSYPWNDTSPTSTVWTNGSGAQVNSVSTTYVAYCFAQIAGFSAFGSFVGNGSSNGPFIYTGFRPKYLMIKKTNNTSDWLITDSARDPYNYVNHELDAELSAAEGTGFNFFNYLSNGFQCTATNPAWNTNGDTYIYIAFAANPFKYSNAF